MEKLLIFSFVVLTTIIVTIVIINKKGISKPTKDLLLKIFATLTVALHFSSLWVDYLKTGTATVDNTMLFPIYPCNICMWLLLIYAFGKNKESKVFKTIAEFLAIGGTVCGVIGLVANDIFLRTPSFLVYDSLKGLLSHSSMIFGTMIILCTGYIEIRALSITKSTFAGLMLFATIGALINSLFKMCRIDSVNAMFMEEFPLDMPGANFITMGLLALVVVLLGTTVYEISTLEKTDRWFNKIRNNEGEKENERVIL